MALNNGEIKRALEGGVVLEDSAGREYRHLKKNWPNYVSAQVYEVVGGEPHFVGYRALSMPELRKLSVKGP